MDRSSPTSKAVFIGSIIGYLAAIICGMILLAFILTGLIKLWDHRDNPGKFIGEEMQKLYKFLGVK